MQARFLPLMAAALFLLILGVGCVSPFDPTAEVDFTTIYELKGDGSLRQVVVMEGEPSSYTGTWEGDCTRNVQGYFDSMLSMMEGMRGMAETQGDEDYETAVQALELMRDAVDCEFHIANGVGVLSVGMSLSREDIVYMNALPGGESEIIVTDHPDGSIEFHFSNVGSAPDPGMGTVPGAPGALKEVRVGVEGSLVSLEPQGYVQEGGYYVYKDPENQLSAGDIRVRYVPGLDLMFLGLAAAVVVLAAVVALLFLKVLKGKGKAKKV